MVLHLDNDKILDIRITCLCLYRKELSLILDLVTTETHVSIRVYQNNSFFLDLACIFIWHVYWPYKIQGPMQNFIPLASISSSGGHFL